MDPNDTHPKDKFPSKDNLNSSKKSSPIHNNILPKLENLSLDSPTPKPPVITNHPGSQNTPPSPKKSDLNTTEFCNSDSSSGKTTKRVALQRNTVPPPINVKDAKLIAEKSLAQKLLFMSPTPSPPISALDSYNDQSPSSQTPSDCFYDPQNPNSPKNTSSIPKSIIKIGVSTERNKKYRRTMEDSHSFIYDFCSVKDQFFAAIFDGHSGKTAAEWCGNNFHLVLQELLTENPDLPIEQVINNTFVKVDNYFSTLERCRSGCTAVTALLIPSPQNIPSFDLYVANVGDARCVYSNNLETIRLTYDHKGDDQFEANRIINAGGYVFNGRVNGVLAVTRSLGDSSMKQFVVGNPYVSHISIPKSSGTLVLACDGLWDVCSDDMAIKLANESPDPQSAAESLVQYAVDNFSTDNISVIVIKLSS
ncbi:Protein phosphatase 2C-like protein [Smittium culicis]|uniref:Protein phosphatase 2C-like protein n=2 Tax=Smittium culicis TaxID=133412 RepID=A0A1R1YN48_9FUNG|nr:Protein phosphatase 2C-like protein [Smittium culicis]